MFDWLIVGLLLGGMAGGLFVLFYVLFAAWDSWRSK
jgi:hypothetical protein